MRAKLYLHQQALEELWKQFYEILYLEILLTFILTRWIFVKIKLQSRALYKKTYERSNGNLDDNQLNVYHSKELVYQKLSRKFKTYFMSNSFYFASRTLVNVIKTL